jgi:bisphosphoglycerate-dependent phosphoglycerate mutase
MAKMTLNKLIKELKELKNNGVWENDIPTIKNLLIEYQNDSQMGTFEEL